MDGDARGGAALSVLNVTGVPIHFIGVGEKPDAFELFYPNAWLRAFWAWETLFRSLKRRRKPLTLKKQETREKNQEEHLFAAGFSDQLQQIKKMGPLSELMAMIPRRGKPAQEHGC